MKKAIVQMSMSALGEFLHLPKDCHVYSVLRTHDDYEYGSISLYLQGEGLPKADPTDSTPKVRLVYEKVNGKVELKTIELAK